MQVDDPQNEFPGQQETRKPNANPRASSRGWQGEINLLNPANDRSQVAV